MRLSVGTQLGPYEILALLGRGGMGEVYRARDSRLGRDVAVKILPEPLAADPAALMRFEREAMSIAALSHPNIVAIFDFGKENGTHFAVMELLEGETLREVIKRGPSPPHRVAEIGAAIAAALGAAHAKGIVHRDLKPENVFLSSGGHVKVLDFGLARMTAAPLAAANTTIMGNMGLTVAGTILGTIGYMSPEQVRGETSEATSDIFSLGLLLYEMATGKPAFSSASAAETIAAILKDTPPRISASSDLDRVVSKCLAKKVSERFQTASAVVAALRFPSPSFPADQNSDAIDSLAVLPFVDVGGDPDIDYLCDGITESLINNLSQIPKLRVVPRSTVFRYKTADAYREHAIRELGVRAVLTGKISRRTGTLIVQAELVDLAVDAQVWGQKYSRNITDIFAFEEEIAREIADALHVKLNNAQKKKLAQRSTEDSQAYQLYLKGRYLWNQRKRSALERAIEYFQQAIDRDPDYALAYAGLADCFVVLGTFTFWPPQQAFPRAKAAAQRAIEIDESLAEAHVALAIVNAVFDVNNQIAVREFERAVSLDANYAVAHQWYGGHLCFVAEFEHGLAELRLAQRLEPLSPMINVQLGVGFYVARRYEESAQVLENIIAFEPGFWPAHFFLGLVSVQQRDNVRAITEISVAAELSGRHPLVICGLGHVLALTGEREKAAGILEELRTRARTEYIAPDHFALVHLALDEEKLALDQLQKSVEERSSYGMWLAVDPRLDRLRTNARFQNILQDLSTHLDLSRDHEQR
jgi:serine/threonine protein kinase